ncbi:rna polymerase sigma-70 [Lucifera butyrica]|uniref:Rna polymerase sigma-70 n=1 Tax=Lucifera butyrica TaxID=1351585 RepID=A0A498RE35_9FIRM|nr:sigma-70 family RNA polymerase sigma factor [Lucifera butyrica]VBB09255.1 rna polymerase sigma-70 [Lucifera butyrica]
MLLHQYLAELKKINLLEPEEEKLLWQNYKHDGDFESRRQLIEHYQPLVFKLAMHWRCSDSMLMDLVQEGTVGLIEAVENFEPARGVAFSLYATHRIRGRMVNFLQREGSLNWAYMDEPLAGDESAGTLSETLAGSEEEVAVQAEHNYLVEQLKTALERLPSKEQLVLNGVYFQNYEPKKLAEDLNMSLSHIYRLQKQGIRRIRGMLAKVMQHW